MNSFGYFDSLIFMANTPLMLCLENTKSLGLVKQCRRLTCYEFNFKNTEDLYMINKENEKFVFLKCNSDSYLYYDDLDVLLQTAYID